MIPKEYLELSLKSVLMLHAPRRADGGASVDDIAEALRALASKIAAEDAARADDQRAWLANLLDQPEP